ncbi:MAG: hypothetical protein AAGG75_06685 [Bacteroidota bacterium]
MKFLSKSTLLLSAIALFFFSCTQKESIEPTLETSTTTVELKENPVAIFSEMEKQFSHTAEEVDAMILAKHGSLEYTMEEKMNLLSDMIQAAYRPEGVVSRTTDQYVLVAQAFADGDFSTDVRVSHGLPSSNLFAIGLFLRRGVVAFAGANANIYLNGSNIQGNILNRNNVDCENDKVRVKATCILQPSGGLITVPRIDCD